MAITIKDVARAADVSIATVSRVLNNVENVNPEVRRNVMRVIQELNFIPNRMAQSIKNNTTNTLGVIITDLKNPFFMEITGQIEQVAAEAGYSILINAVGDSAKKESDSLRLMAEKRVDGIIVASSGNNEDYLSELRDGGTPVVIIDRKSFSHRFDAVYIDKMKVMQRVNKYLFDKGHRRVALVTGAKNLSTNFDRYLGYVRSYYDAGLPVDESLIYCGSFSEEYGREALRDLMAREDRPTAIVSGSGLITAGILKEARVLGISIPSDVSLVSFGNIEMAELIEPRLTYTLSRQDEIGREAARIMLEKIRNPGTNIVETVLPAEIVEGDSVRDLN